MFFRKPKIELSGLEIDTTCIRFVKVIQKEHLWQELTQLEVDLPQGLVQPGFNKKNIQNSSELIDILSQLKREVAKGSCSIGVSLPSESTRFLVKSFPKLPEGEQNIKEMILWSLRKSSKIDLANIDVKWSVFNNKVDSSAVLMIGMASKRVLHEYVDVLEKACFAPRCLCSSDLNLFNFYSSAISENGTVAWLGVFPESISLFVLKDACPLFYKNIKKILIAQNDADNIDMLLQYFMDENPDLAIDRYYLSATSSFFENTLSRSVFHADQYEVLSPFNQILISSTDKANQWNYASTIGAAWSTLIS